MPHLILPHWVVLLFSGEQANGVSGQLQGVKATKGRQPVGSNGLNSVFSPVSERLEVQRTPAWLQGMRLQGHPHPTAGYNCDTPGVSFVLCREIYLNLGCSVKISISRSHLSPFIKLLMNDSPNLELFDLKNSQIWSLLKLFVSRSKHKFESQYRLATPVQTHLFGLSIVVILSNRCLNPLSR
jgi:hypothetical protein